MSEVLIVDDNKDICWLISYFLKEEGYEIDIACDGSTALEKIRDKRYDIIILDYKLYEINGLTVLEKIRDIRPSSKVIMISAYGDKSTRKRAEELEVLDFLEKPLDMKKLVKVIKKGMK